MTQYMLTIYQPDGGPPPPEFDALDLDTYHIFHAVRADLLRRLGRDVEATKAYERAIERTDNAAEREFLRRRRQSLGG